MDPNPQIAFASLVGLVGVYAGLYGAGITKAVDVARNVFDKAGTAPKWVWNVLSLVFGVTLALGLQLDLGGLMVGHAPTWLVRVGIGVGIGGSSSGWHELFSAISSIQKVNAAKATVALASLTVPPVPSADVTVTTVESEPEAGGSKTTVRTRKKPPTQ